MAKSFFLMYPLFIGTLKDFDYRVIFRREAPLQITLIFMFVGYVALTKELIHLFSQIIEKQAIILYEWLTFESADNNHRNLSDLKQQRNFLWYFSMTDVSMLALNYLVDKNSTISEKGRNLRGRKTDR